MARRTTNELVLDKHISADLANAVGYRPISAAIVRPTNAYRGEHEDDEDFTDVLQLGAEREATILSRDRAMIQKARDFCLEQSASHKGASEWCTRGVIILPAEKTEQIKTLEMFQNGGIDVLPVAGGIEPPRTLADVAQQNVGIDLTAEHPRAIDLCPHHKYG